MISSRTIEKVKNDIDLVAVVSELVQLKQRGSNFIGLCPFHGEKSPSFNVRQADNYYHCFGCGVSGNSISFVMHHRGLSFPDAVEYLAHKFGVEIEYTEAKQTQKREDRNIFFELNAKALEFFQLNLIEELNRKEAVFKYVVSRSLNKQSLTEYKVGFSPNSWTACLEYLLKFGFTEEQIYTAGLVRRSSKGTFYDTFKGRLVFPIMFDQTRVAGFGGRLIPEIHSEGPKYLNSSETPVYEKSKILYGFPQASESARSDRLIYVVEGYMDVISLAQAGVKNVVAVCGTSLTSEHVKKMSTVSSRVRLLFDNDEAGRNAASKSFTVFINSGVDTEVIFIEEGKDPDELAKAHGERTKSELEKLPRKSLIECFILNEVKKSGHKSVAEIGAAIKGKIAKQLEELIVTVTNSVERSELLKQASFVLGLNYKEQAWKQPPVEKNTNQVITVITNFEKEVLTLLIAAPEFLDTILKSANVCALLSSQMTEVISGLPEAPSNFAGFHTIAKHAGRIAKTKDWDRKKALTSILANAEEMLKKRSLKMHQPGSTEDEKLKYYQDLLNLRRKT